MLKLGDGSVAIIGIRLDTKEEIEQAAQEIGAASKQRWWRDLWIIVGDCPPENP